MECEHMEEIAANRLCIITPLLDPIMDKAKHPVDKESISMQYGINERTIRRWINLYNEKGFEGLMPKIFAFRTFLQCNDQSVILHKK